MRILVDDGGDFIMILNRYKRFNEHFLRVCVDKFKRILDRLDLLNLSLMGNE